MWTIIFYKKLDGVEQEIKRKGFKLFADCYEFYQNNKAKEKAKGVFLAIKYKEVGLNAR